MAHRTISTLERRLEWFSRKSTEWAGSSWAFIVAVLIVLAWAITGPLFDFSDTWQLVINTGTTIVTFWMVFLIQRTQNKDSAAIQLKLNELIAASKGASNRMLNIEDLSESELRQLHKRYRHLRRRLRSCAGESHTVEEELNHGSGQSAVRRDKGT